MWWRLYTLTVLMWFSCCSLRWANAVKKYDAVYTAHPHCSSYNGLSSCTSCSLICATGWTRPILYFRREPVCWSWFMELCVYVAETLSLNFSRLFIFSPNTGPCFCAIISLTITVTACVCSWPVRLSVFYFLLFLDIIRLNYSELFSYA